MPAVRNPDPALLSAAFRLVFRQGRAPPSCPVPDETGLLNRIQDMVPDAPPASCREALIRVRRLSFDVMEVCALYREGEYGMDETAKPAAIQDLQDRDPGFLPAEYLTAFSIGLMWAQLQ